MGVRNVLCLTGDGVQAGDQPEAKPVFDLNSTTLLRTARMLRDQGRFLSGRALQARPHFFLGAAANPFAPPYEFRAAQLAKKVAGGAQFIQTQFCFDVPRLREFMAQTGDLGLHGRVCILVGVGPLRSAKAAEWIRAHVPGVHIPDEVVRRLSGVPADRQRQEGGICAWKSSSRCVSSPAYVACTSWPTVRRSWSPRSLKPPASCQGARKLASSTLMDPRRM